MSVVRSNGSVNATQGLMMRDCVNSTVVVVGSNVTLRNLLVFNTSHGVAPLRVAPGSRATIVNSVFLANSGVSACARAVAAYTYVIELD